ncbi:hypothetical protein RIF29_14948 [Crotalaria pallida]|uniref:Uncharacterized protein n=1 Tax=Crotalaria pallida TaxID=3830 RepID=A0AAN9FCN4_CROPI
MHDDQSCLVKQKTLIIWGQNDRIISNKLAVIPECGHIPHVERQKSVVKFIVEFLQRETKTNASLTGAAIDSLVPC